ncbi:hypothetical protein RHPLAN_31500 [Rhodoplanes sp. Z2-YC6860]|nr:hypothetical protein RHPLAN_31500 [Rhodoplanes sp. Z2-YC6860]
MAEPVFGPVRSFFVILEIGFKLLDVIFSGAKLERKLVGDAQCVLAVFLRHAGGPLKQSQDFLASLVESVLAVRNRTVGVWPNLIVLLHYRAPLRSSQLLSASEGEPPNFHIGAAMLKSLKRETCAVWRNVAREKASLPR